MAGLKYDLRRVEEIYYDVKIRGLSSNGDLDGDKQLKHGNDTNAEG